MDFRELAAITGEIGFRKIRTNFLTPNFVTLFFSLIFCENPKSQTFVKNSLI